MFAGERDQLVAARLAVLVLAVSTVGCVRHNPAADFRGVGRGWVTSARERPDVPLSPAGANVAVLDPAAALHCRHIGDVSGVVSRRGVRPAGADRAGAIATLSRESAIHDARNLAAAHQADAIVIDADELWETGRLLVLFVHGRAVRCP
jgi:hypothetical protein